MVDQANARKNASTSNKQQGSANPQGKQGKGGKHKNKKDRSNKKAQNEDEQWKKVPPKLGESEKKKVSKTEWLRCGEHMVQTLHSTSVCRVKKAREEQVKQENQW